MAENLKMMCVMRAASPSTAARTAASCANGVVDASACLAAASSAGVRTGHISGMSSSVPVSVSVLTPDYSGRCGKARPTRRQCRRCRIGREACFRRDDFVVRWFGCRGCGGGLRHRLRDRLGSARPLGRCHLLRALVQLRARDSQIPAFAVSGAIEAVIPVLPWRRRGVRLGETVIGCAGRLTAQAPGCKTNCEERWPQAHRSRRHFFLTPVEMIR
jgi:hypothetical protein